MMIKDKFSVFFMLTIIISIVLGLTACNSNSSDFERKLQLSSAGQKLQLTSAGQMEPILKQINVAEFKERLETEPSSLFVLDIRYRDDFNETHLEGSINIPFSEVIERKNELPKNQEIAVVCYKGKSAKQTAKDLRELGYNPIVIEGGFEAISIKAEDFRIVN